MASIPNRDSFDAFGNFIGSQTPPDRIDESGRVASMPDRNAFDAFGNFIGSQKTTVNMPSQITGSTTSLPIKVPPGGITGLPTSLLGDYAFDYFRPKPITLPDGVELQPQDISQGPLGVISDRFSYQVKPMPISMPKPVKGFALGGLTAGTLAGVKPIEEEQPTQEQPKQESNAVDINQPAAIFLNSILENDPNGIFSKQINEVYGSKKKAQAALQEKIGAIASTNTPEERATAITTSVGAPNTEEGLRDVASSVGIDVAGKNINTLVNEMTQVALNTSIADPGSMAARYGQALLFGYQNALAVQTARAGAGSGGGVKSSNYRNAKNAYQDAFTQAMSVSEREVPEGMSKEQYAIQFAESVVNRTYTPDEIRAAGITMESTPTTEPQTSEDGRRIAYDPSGKPFYSTDGVNYVDADGNPFVPPNQE